MKNSKIFKNCEIIYFKTQECPQLINSSLKGKIIISDFPELKRKCSVKGLIHILNMLSTKIPSDKIDCIICGERDIDLESKLIRKNYNIPIFYYKTKERWCGICRTVKPFPEGKIGKYCSEKCMRKSTGFTDFKADSIKDLSINSILGKKSTIIKFDSNMSNKKEVSNTKSKSREKFQTSMIKEAVRLEYAFKREDYKKQMRQPSMRKARLSQKKEISNKISKQCKSMTKKGKKCTNKAVEGSDYCGIPSHQS